MNLAEAKLVTQLVQRVDDLMGQRNIYTKDIEFPSRDEVKVEINKKFVYLPQQDFVAFIDTQIDALINRLARLSFLLQDPRFIPEPIDFDDDIPF